MIEPPHRDEGVIALPPVVVVARDASRRQALIEIAAFAGLEVLGAYPAWLPAEPGEAVIVVDDEAAADVSGIAAVILGGEPSQPWPGTIARAYLPRNAPPEQLAAAVFAVANGLSVASAGTVSASAVAAGEDLTARERDVLLLLANGLSNRAIAAALVISENTVKFHVASILAKLAAQSRAEAVMTAVRRGLLPL